MLFMQQLFARGLLSVLRLPRSASGILTYRGKRATLHLH
jgi:hypothetical protein